MAWIHLKAATESDLYDGQGSYKNIMYRICSLVRKDGQQHAGVCTASEEYLAQTTGYSLRQVQRAVAQFKQDGVFTVRTYRMGGKEFNHYRPNMALLNSRRRNPEEPVLVSEALPDDTETVSEEGTRQVGIYGADKQSQATRQVGGVVCITSEIKTENVNASNGICRTELRSSGKGLIGGDSANPLSGENNGGCAPKPPLVPVESNSQPTSSPSGYDTRPASLTPLESAAAAAHSKEEMLATLARREPVPAPPSREDLVKSTTPRPTTPLQIAKALVEDTKRSAWDIYLRAYSLSYQFAGYLEQRAAKGEKAFAFNQWEVMYTADFIDALNRGWTFKDLEDAIDHAQTTKFRFTCCTPRRLLENGESLMKQVYAIRRKGMTIRQKLGDRYSSWYLDHAGTLELEEQKQSFESEAEASHNLQDEDIPIQTLATTGKVKCINPDCPYRFDTWAQMGRHFTECFAKALEEIPIDPADALEEEMEDAYDDKYGVIPCAYYHWYEEDKAEGRWEQYAPENADGGMMFNPWADEDAACLTGTGALHEL